MKWALWTVGGLALIAVGIAVAARVAPSDPQDWHQMPEAVTDRDLEGGAMRVVGAGEDGLSRLDAIIRAEDRTEVLAGSVDEGMITYVTRSRVFGFPDYVTIRRADKQIEIYSRLRFGKSDMGVNAQRLDRWLALFSEGGG